MTFSKCQNCADSEKACGCQSWKGCRKDEYKIQGDFQIINVVYIITVDTYHYIFVQTQTVQSSKV